MWEVSYFSSNRENSEIPCSFYKKQARLSPGEKKELLQCLCIFTFYILLFKFLFLCVLQYRYNTNLILKCNYFRNRNKYLQLEYILKAVLLLGVYFQRIWGTTALFFSMFFHFRFLQGIEYYSLCKIVGSCYLFNISQCVYVNLQFLLYPSSPFPLW